MHMLRPVKSEPMDLFAKFVQFLGDTVTFSKSLFQSLISIFVNNTPLERELSSSSNAPSAADGSWQNSEFQSVKVRTDESLCNVCAIS